MDTIDQYRKLAQYYQQRAMDLEQRLVLVNAEIEEARQRISELEAVVQSADTSALDDAEHLFSETG